jgi:hypothetical protein
MAFKRVVYFSNSFGERLNPQSDFSHVPKEWKRFHMQYICLGEIAMGPSAKPVRN